MNVSDIFSADLVEVTIENDRVWIDIDGSNRFRAYRIKRLVLTDRRPRHPLPNCTGACLSRGCNCQLREV